MEMEVEPSSSGSKAAAVHQYAIGSPSPQHQCYVAAYWFRELSCNFLPYLPYIMNDRVSWSFLPVCVQSLHSPPNLQFLSEIWPLLSFVGAIVIT